MKKIMLNDNWKMQMGDASLDTKVPGSACSTLLEHGLIQDPFYRDNELLVLQELNADFTFEKVFQVTEEMLAADSLLLCFDGIDTLADIFLNGELIGQTYNMHRIWEIDIREFAKAGETGGVTMELLWENASPTSDFEGQDVALDLSEYDGVFIIFDLTGSNNYRPSPMFVFEKDTGKFYNNFAEAGYKLAQRNAAVYSNKVTFGNASSMNTYGSQGSTNNKLIKPVYIYGIKGVVR